VLRAPHPGATGPPWLEFHDLAQRLATQGMRQISRSILADLEIARRENISVAELLAFAVVPGVASVHLLVHRRALSPPRDAGADGDAGPSPGVDTRHEAAARH
jgi:hypothetical protein